MSTNENLVSIVMPCYNGARHIEDSIKSVLNQCYQNWELIVVDDLSKDNSVAIVDKFVKKDSRIKLVAKETNSGCAASRNQAVELARGDFIAFLDCDDIWDENFLTEQIQFMKHENLDFSCSSYRMIDENNREILYPHIVPPKKFSFESLLRYNIVGTLTAIYRVKSVGKIYFDVNLHSVRDDYACWLDILRKSSRAQSNPKILASYRVHSNSVTSNKFKLIRSHFNFLTKREKLSFFKASHYTLIWGIRGFRKFYNFFPKGTE